jgi:hypothetical protein
MINNDVDFQESSRQPVGEDRGVGPFPHACLPALSEPNAAASVRFGAQLESVERAWRQQELFRGIV